MSRVFLMAKNGKLKHTYSMRLRKILEDEGWQLGAVIDGKDMSFMYYHGIGKNKEFTKDRNSQGGIN